MKCLKLLITSGIVLAIGVAIILYFLKSVPVSASLLSPGDMDILSDTHTPYGNDGNHFNLAIKEGMNGAVPDSVADALHEASDHLPVYADFVIAPNTVETTVELPLTFSLSQNYPNPFNPITTIAYSLPHTSEVVLKIHNLLGQEVKTLVNEIQTPGNKLITWDGRDNQGDIVGSGVYIYSIKTGIIFKARKMVRLP